MTKEANDRICVLLVVDDLGYGGAERQVIELANNLDPLRFEVHVCTLSNYLPLRNQLKDSESKLNVLSMKHRFDFMVVFRLVNLLRKLKVDIVHGFLFRAEIVSRLAGRMAGTKCVIGSERNANRIEVGKKLYFTYKLTQPFVDLIIANSQAGMSSHSKIYKYPPEKYRIVHNGVDTDRFQPAETKSIRNELGIPDDCSVVGAFANYKKQKNHPMLFEAFRQVLATKPRTRLLLVGEQTTDSRGKLDDYIIQLNKIIDDLDIRKECIFMGHQDNTERLFSACDLTVLSSFHEGTPNVLLESMACGVPVIATNVCDNSYIVKDGEVGYLVEVGDEMVMANRIISLLNDETTRKEMGFKARKWVLEEFSTKRLAEKTASVYMELLYKKKWVIFPK
jgi:glycosyltransferase involved in cell wall biosynthesis